MLVDSPADRAAVVVEAGPTWLDTVSTEFNDPGEVNCRADLLYHSDCKSRRWKGLTRGETFVPSDKRTILDRSYGIGIAVE